jgi:hypothetical protein
MLYVGRAGVRVENRRIEESNLACEKYHKEARCGKLTTSPAQNRAHPTSHLVFLRIEYGSARYHID